MTRPARGFGHYLRDMVYGALDGVITTMAVLAGTQGASLSVRVGLILGLANLLGEGTVEARPRDGRGVRRRRGGAARRIPCLGVDRRARVHAGDRVCCGGARR